MTRLTNAWQMQAVHNTEIAQIVRICRLENMLLALDEKGSVVRNDAASLAYNVILKQLLISASWLPIHQHYQSCRCAIYKTSTLPHQCIMPDFYLFIQDASLANDTCSTHCEPRAVRISS